MTFKNELVNFDTEKIGIIVQITSANGSIPKFITLDNKPRVFNNLDVAKIMANTIIEGGTFKFWIYWDNMDNLININQCRYNKKNHTFQFIDNSSKTIYKFKEVRTRKLSNLGYLCFDDGDTVRFEKETGRQRQIELLDIITGVCTDLLIEKWEEYGITRIENRRKELVIHIKSTTARIHVAFNSRIMDINQEKGLTPGKKRIPFIRSMDKYVTFYIFASKDIAEGKRIGGEDKAKYIIDNIVGDLQKYYEDAKPKFIPIEYTKFIDLED